MAGRALLHLRVENLPAGAVAQQAEGPLAVGHRPSSSRPWAGRWRRPGTARWRPRPTTRSRRRRTRTAPAVPPAPGMHAAACGRRPMGRPLSSPGRPAARTPGCNSRNTASTISVCLLTSSAAVVATARAAMAGGSGVSETGVVRAPAVAASAVLMGDAPETSSARFRSAALRAGGKAVGADGALSVVLAVMVRPVVPTGIGLGAGSDSRDESMGAGVALTVTSVDCTTTDRADPAEDPPSTGVELPATARPTELAT